MKTFEEYLSESSTNNIAFNKSLSGKAISDFINALHKKGTNLYTDDDAIVDSTDASGATAATFNYKGNDIIGITIKKKSKNLDNFLSVQGLI